MINLTQAEKKIIKFAKGHYPTKYPFTDSWIKSFKPLFIDIYGWGKEEVYYGDYLNCTFNKLLEIHLKIVDDKSGTNLQLRGIFEAAFYKGLCRTEELPIERAICSLFGLIQSNTYLEDGVLRYTLD